MGDRGNIIVSDRDGTIYLYTQWAGSELPQIVASGLDRGRTRWDDQPYLTRILFCELVPADSWREETGYGISVVFGDGGTEVKVNIDTQQVSDDEGTYSFEEYVQLHNK